MKNFMQRYQNSIAKTDAGTAEGRSNTNNKQGDDNTNNDSRLTTHKPNNKPSLLISANPFNPR